MIHFINFIQIAISKYDFSKLANFIENCQVSLAEKIWDHKTACSKQIDCSCKYINLCLRSPVPIFLTFSFHFNSVFVYLILSSWILIFLVGQTRDPQTAKLSRPHWKNLSRLWIPGSSIFSRWLLKIQSLKNFQLWNFSSRISVYWIFELIKIKGQQKIGHSVKYRWIYFLARWTHLQMSRTLKIRGLRDNLLFRMFFQLTSR